MRPTSCGEFIPSMNPPLGGINVRRILFQSQSCASITQWNAQGFLRTQKFRRIAAGCMALQLMRNIFLGFWPMTLTDNVGRRSGLQFEHAGSQHDRERGEHDQRSKLKRQHAQRSSLMSCDLLRFTGRIAGSKIFA